MMEDKSSTMPLLEGVNYLIAMFPNLDQNEILRILYKNNNRLEETIEELLSYPQRQSKQNYFHNQPFNQNIPQSIHDNDFPLNNNQYKTECHNTNTKINQTYGKSDSENSKSSCNLNINDDSSSDSENEEMEIDSSEKNDLNYYDYIKKIDQKYFEDLDDYKNDNKKFNYTTISPSKDYLRSDSKKYKWEFNKKRNNKNDYSEKLNKRGTGDTNKSREKDFKVINYSFTDTGEKDEDKPMKNKNTYSKKIKRFKRELNKEKTYQ